MQYEFSASLSVIQAELRPYVIPEEFKYIAMIHQLAKEYGQALNVVRETFSELDFWEMMCLNSVDAANLKDQQK